MSGEKLDEKDEKAGSETPQKETAPKPKERLENEIHSELMKKVTELMKTQGFKIWADYEGFEKPQEINGEIPDIYAEKDEETVVIEIETCASINWPETRKEYEIFANYSITTGTSFQVYVPIKCMAQAIKQASEWGFDTARTVQFRCFGEI